MKRKMAAFVLCMSTFSMLLTGCGGGNKEEEAKSSDAGDDGEITEIIWQYPSTGNLGAGFEDVENALNEMLERDIGVHVTFEPCSLMDSQKEASLMVSAGEKLDICLTAFTGLGPLVDSELIVPLDDEAYDCYDVPDECGTDLPFRFRAVLSNTKEQRSFV